MRGFYYKGEFGSRIEDVGQYITYTLEVHDLRNTHTTSVRELTLGDDPIVIERQGDRADLLSAVYKSKAILSVMDDGTIAEDFSDSRLGSIIMQVSAFGRVLWSGVYTCEMVQQQDTMYRNIVQFEFMDMASYLYYVECPKPTVGVRYAVRDLLKWAYDAIKPKMLADCVTGVDCTWTLKLVADTSNAQLDSRLGEDASEHSIGKALENVARYFGLTLIQRNLGASIGVILEDRNLRIGQRKRLLYGESGYSSVTASAYGNVTAGYRCIRYDDVTKSYRELNDQTSLVIKRDYACQQNVTEILHALEYSGPTSRNQRWLHFTDPARYPYNSVALERYASEYKLGEFLANQGEEKITQKYWYIRDYSDSPLAESYYYYQRDSYDADTKTWSFGTTPMLAMSRAHGIGEYDQASGMTAYQIAYCPTAFKVAYNSTPLQWTNALALIDGYALSVIGREPVTYVRSSEAQALSRAPLVTYAPWMISQGADYLKVGTKKCTLKLDMRVLMVDPRNVIGLPTDEPHYDGDWPGGLKADAYTEVVPFCVSVSVKDVNGDTRYWNGTTWTTTDACFPLKFKPQKYSEVFGTELSLVGGGTESTVETKAVSNVRSNYVRYDYEPAEVMEGYEIALDDLPGDNITVEDIRITINRPGPYAVRAQDGAVIGFLSGSNDRRYVATAVYVTKLEATLLSQTSAIKKSLLEVEEPKMQADVRHIIGTVSALRKDVGVDEDQVRYGVWEPLMDPNYSTVYVLGDPLRTGDSRYEGMAHDVENVDPEIVRLMRLKESNDSREVLHCRTRIDEYFDEGVVISFSDKPTSADMRWVIVRSERHLRSGFVDVELAQSSKSALNPLYYRVETEHRVPDVDVNGNIKWDVNMRAVHNGIKR